MTKEFLIFISDVEAYLTNPEDKYYKDSDMPEGQHNPNQNGKYWKQKNNHISSIGKERTSDSSEHYQKIKDNQFTKTQFY